MKVLEELHYEFLKTHKANRRIFILGSCITRDAFRIANNTLNLEEYVGRTSLISIMSNPIPIGEICSKSAFHNKCIYIDFNKTIFEVLEKYVIDYLLIDLIDERFNLCKINNDYVTLSKCLRESNYELKNHEIIKRHRESTHKLWETRRTLFFNKLINIVPEENIILHKAYWTNKFTDGKNIHQFDEKKKLLVKNSNEYLNRYYTHIQNNFPKIKVINMKKYSLANKNHKWGLAPFHYEDNYYKRFMYELYKII